MLRPWRLRVIWARTEYVRHSPTSFDLLGGGIKARLQHTYSNPKWYVLEHSS
ncbi:hypothetical protein VCRA2117O376_280044 [Vibrio crassostreae]|nr:hypothetical protein VCRA2115O371_260016 [Vibrio crassostreae]CAK1964180.1 hypothetical protein VCRA2113O199_270017 [Vibrio crassostreae]CAK1967568.1 hypothetical protein VCRA2117O376_280044 [Vibrio crassostreae]CAK1987987.1 hypothetical protein VCRA2116O30_290033 [Vibrio crassostreae]CAK2030257.1 hypothetical protein VCRA2113O20_300008 [Vibrio crassostreae]